MTKRSIIAQTTSASTLVLLALAAQAGDTSTAPVISSWQKPDWLTDLSFGVKESYDDNIFLSGVAPRSGYTVQPGSAAALKNVGSWVTTFSPKIGVNLAPLLGTTNAVRTLSLGYAPDFAIYHDAASESYDAHRFIGAVKGGADAFTFGVDDAFTYIDGNKYGPTYPGTLISAFGICAPRERREQIQDRASVVAQYNAGDWFVRPTASLLDYDLMTHLVPNGLNLGYMNYVSRYDVNGGADAGYKVTPDMAFTLGYRYGHQYQGLIPEDSMESGSDYQRVLLGVEGKPWKWLDVKIQGGPDFRNYDAAAAVNDKNRVTYYGEAVLAATVSTKDTVTFKYKGWQWVSSIGDVPYFDSAYDLSYHHKVTDKLGLDLGAKLLTANYDMGNVIARDDWQYSVSAGLGYAFNSHASVNLAYALNLGRSAQDAANNLPENQYDDQQVSLAAAYKF